jgi:2-amino-4-hydroxy-6-hydroxymethyldihydropteridine diphosphokinase
MRKTYTAYLLTGSNLGDRKAFLNKAKAHIDRRAGKVIAASGYYKTAAWGIEDQPDFWNQALAIMTTLEPESLLETLLDIERELGRERIEKWGSRTIDIDILLYDDQIINTPNLTIPHLFLHERNFSMVPLMEIAGEIEHPIFKKTIEELYWASNDPLDVYFVDTL